eukprot:TRINITY_DN7056_c0_g1_i1.p1 TRINITY_DN7056_c0_g1~~TRINITY_DN7056_c0_g1_i1.p1  ORF type:complete len:131 (+),score=20.68 TRINITY_DN7056_c0_g1_i1:75-467(+)
MESIKSQLSFNNKSSCECFEPNYYKKVECLNCCYSLIDHRSDAVADEFVHIYIAHAQGKEGGNTILEAQNGYGSLYLGGVKACTMKFVQLKNISHIITAAGGLDSFYPRWSKTVMPEVEKSGVSFYRTEW